MFKLECDIYISMIAYQLFEKVVEGVRLFNAALCSKDGPKGRLAKGVCYVGLKPIAGQAELATT